MRLIDADGLIEICNVRIEGYESLGSYNRADELKIMKEKIESMPTAYNVDAVVAELENAESVKNFGSRNSENLLIPLKDAIDIVRNAGKDGAEC